MKISLSVIVPVYNEEYLIEESLSRLIVLGESEYLEKVQILVVNDSSTDNTPEVLRKIEKKLTNKYPKFEWIFITHDKNQGKGKAIQTALKVATCKLTVIHDADLEYNPKDLLSMIPIFLNESADAVFGSRFASGQYRRVLFYKHQLGNKLITFLCNFISDLNLTDIETCYKMIETSLFKSIPIVSNDFRFEPEITIKLSKRNARIFEVPISYSGRTYQEGKKINWKDGFKAIWAILRFGFSDNIYVEDPYGSKILARLSRADKFNAWMADCIRPFIGQNVLEIGAGVGNLTTKIIPRRTYYATDINPLYLNRLKTLKIGKPYLNVSYLDIQDSEDFKKVNQVDTVICLNVIEHIENDHAAIKNIYDLLSIGGRAVILVPQGKRLFGSFDEVLGHKRRYSRADIVDLAAQTNFKLISMSPFNRVGTVAWFLNAKVMKRKTFGLFQIMMLNLLTPSFRKIDNLLPLPPLSLIAVLEK